MLPFLRHFFIPHHSNNHRPKLLHPKAFIFYILFLFVLQINFLTLRTLNPNILGFATDINVEKLVELTNQQRAENNLPALSLNPQLSQAAADKARDMFAKNYWAHNSPDGLTPWVFIRQAGYTYFYAGENLAKNFANSQGVVNGWMASAGHRANILKPEYQDIGFAVVNGLLEGEETTLVVQIFGAKQNAIAARLDTAPTPLPERTEDLVSKLTPTPTMGNVLPDREKTATLAALSQTTPVDSKEFSIKPVLNLFSLNRNLSLLLIFFLIMIFSFDAIFVWRKKIVRVGGHNLAHIFFLLIVAASIWFIQQGVVKYPAGSDSVAINTNYYDGRN